MKDSQTINRIVSIDPGTAKCGVAVLGRDGEVMLKKVVSRGELVEFVTSQIENMDPTVVVVGASTQGRAVAEELSGHLGRKIEMVDESYSTEKAKDLFWSENKATGIWRIFPPSFRPMPRPIDDYAAVIIGRRWLGLD